MEPSTTYPQGARATRPRSSPARTRPPGRRAPAARATPPARRSGGSPPPRAGIPPAVALERVEPLGEDDVRRIEAGDSRQRRVERPGVARPVRALRQGLVEGVPLPRAGPGLAREPGVRRVAPLRLAVEAAVEHLRAGVEDVLGAVAVVDVQVEDRHPGAPAAGVAGEQALGGEGGVVEVAVAPEGARRGVVPRGPAERVGGALRALQEEIGPGQGAGWRSPRPVRASGPAGACRCPSPGRGGRRRGTTPPQGPRRRPRRSAARGGRGRRARGRWRPARGRSRGGGRSARRPGRPLRARPAPPPPAPGARGARGACRTGSPSAAGARCGAGRRRCAR